MDLGFCSTISKECVDKCQPYALCVKHDFCVRNGIEDCPLASEDASCELAPKECSSDCAQYAPCFVCQNSCDFKEDRDCDDGGFNSEYSSCPRGSDCADCGPRVLQIQAPPPPPNDSCVFMPSRCIDQCAQHVECLQYLSCALTDEGCASIEDFAGSCDLVPRMCILQCGAFARCMLCTNTCDFDMDDDCDDGGIGSEYSSCPLGSDCADCGPRGRSSLVWHALPPSPPLPSSPRPLPAPPSNPLPPPIQSMIVAPPPLKPSSSAATGWIVALVILFPAAIGSYFIYKRYTRRQRSSPPLVSPSISSPLSSVTNYVPPI